MENSIVEISARGMALVPVVIAVAQLVKDYIGPRWVPLLSLGLGVVFSVSVGGVTFLDSSWLGGLVVGLLSVGAFSGTRATITPAPAPEDPPNQ